MPECERCGAETEDLENDMCPDCRVVCFECGEIFPEAHSREVIQGTCCPECWRGLAVRCELCAEYYLDNAGSPSSLICPSCYDDAFFCESCDTWRHSDDYRGDGVCVACYDAQEETEAQHLHNYHWGHNRRLRFLGGDGPYYGVELETDKYTDLHDASNDLFEISNNESIFWQEEDSSLGNGIEIITMPASLEYHQQAMPWKAISEAVRRSGGISHEAGTCGLHIHVGVDFFRKRKGCGNAFHPEELPILRLLYLQEKFWDQLEIFSRRTRDQWRHYAQRYNDTFVGKKLWEAKGCGRYMAMNVSGSATVEWRLPRGTLNVSTILATLEMFDHLCQLARKMPARKLHTMTWDDITGKIDKKTHPNLVPYLERRGLYHSTKLEGGE